MSDDCIRWLSCISKPDESEGTKRRKASLRPLDGL